MIYKLKTTLVILFIVNITFSQHSPANSADASLVQLAIEFKADYGSLSRFYKIAGSPERIARFETFYNNYFKKINQISFDTLSTNGRIDYLLFKKHLNSKLFLLKKKKEAYATLNKWVTFGNPLYTLEKQRRRGKHLNASKVANQLNRISKQLQTLSRQLKTEQVVFSKKLILYAKAIIGGQKTALKQVYTFYDGYDPRFSWWVTKPYQLLDSLLTDYSSLLKTCVDKTTLSKNDNSGIIGTPIGKKELLRQLDTEMIPYSPEELIKIALNEFSWCENELLKVSKEMGFDKNWKAAQEKVKQAYVNIGFQPEKMYNLYNISVDFLKTHNLLTIPPLAEETWRMTMLSPKRQLMVPFFLGGEVLQIAYPTNTMSHEDKLMSLRSNNPHFAKAVIHHELIAGHHLQRFMNNRYKSYRFFYTPFWTEGWALYWELLLWDKGFAKTPEDRIGMLFWRMHRCARIIFSLNYHLKKWSPQQCIDYLIDKVGHERSTAEGEVRRSFTGNYGPLYQIAYMVGGLQFYALRKELVESNKMTDKTFHDTILREHTMPVEMVRANLLKIPLEKNFKSSWRFYKDLK